MNGIPLLSQVAKNDQKITEKIDYPEFRGGVNSSLALNGLTL